MNDMNGFDIDRNSVDVMDEVGDLVTDGVQIEYGCFFFLFSLLFRLFRLVSGEPSIKDLVTDGVQIEYVNDDL